MENHTSAALKVAQGGIIAALYVVLTLVSNAFGLANGAIQVRISEALTVLPVFTPAAIPGLFAGCIISNTLTGAVLPDIIFGSLATLAAGIVTYRIRHLNRFLAPVPPILANTLVIPFVLRYAYGAEDAIPFMMLTVFAGEFISCGVLGMMLYPVMSRILRRDG